jgi:hypothetical protein
MNQSIAEMGDLGTNATLRPLSIRRFRQISVWAARAPEWIWVSRNRRRIMETRLIIAYALIAAMVGMAIFGGTLWQKKRLKARSRDAGKGY